MLRPLFLFLLSMVPVIELRGAVPIGIGWGYPFWMVFLICVIGNILPVPVLIPFAGGALRWCAEWPKIGWIFQKIIDTGNQKAARAKSSRHAIRFALYLFVAIPAPGTGAWSGCLIATLLQMKVREAFWPIAAGVATAGIIMGVASYGALGLIGLA